MKVLYNKGKTTINFGEHERLEMVNREMNAGQAFIFACDAKAEFEYIELEGHLDLNELVEAIAQVSETTSIMYWRNVFDKLAERYSNSSYNGFNKHMANIVRELIDDHSPIIMKEEFADWSINSYVVDEIHQMIESEEIVIDVNNEEIRGVLYDFKDKGVNFAEEYLEELDEGVQWIDVSYKTRTKEMFLTFYA